MNKAELIAAIAAKTGETKKDAEAAVNALVEVVTDALVKGDKIQLWQTKKTSKIVFYLCTRIGEIY